MIDRYFKPWAEEEHGEFDLSLSSTRPIASDPVRVLAPESEWEALRKFDRAMGMMGEATRDIYQDPNPVIAVHPSCDLFAPYDGPLRDELLCDLYWNANGVGVTRSMDLTTDELLKLKPVTHAAVLARVFRLIDACPNCDWILPTAHPKNVNAMWPNGGSLDHYKISKILGSTVKSMGPKRPNVSLAVIIRTQADLERIPPALACRDLVGKVCLWIEPAEEIDLTLVSNEMIAMRKASSVQDRIRGLIGWGEKPTYPFDRVFIVGATCDVCSGTGFAHNGPTYQAACNCDGGYEIGASQIIDQCEAAGVSYEIIEQEAGQ